jgi:hypothetical protein
MAELQYPDMARHDYMHGEGFSNARKEIFRILVRSRHFCMATPVLEVTETSAAP